MYKQAAGDSPWWIFMPGHRFLGKTPDTDKLPDLLGNSDANNVLWSTIGSTLTLGTLAATATAIANKVVEKAWDRKRAEIHRNKVNSLYSYNTPNTAPDVEAVKEIRELGITEPRKIEQKAPKLLENNAPVEKTASVAAALIPPLVSIPAAFAIGNMTKDVLEEDRGEELDKEIAELRNKLDKLYARHLELQGVSKTANDDGADRPGPGGKLLAALMLTPLAISAITGYATYLYTKKKDENRQKLKMLQEHVLPQNLTNTPSEVQLVLGENNTIPSDRGNQGYIEDLNAKVSQL